MKLFGDGFGEGGNDADALSTAIEGHVTSGPKHTEKAIDELLARFAKTTRESPSQGLHLRGGLTDGRRQG